MFSQFFCQHANVRLAEYRIVVAWNDLNINTAEGTLAPAKCLIVDPIIGSLVYPKHCEATRVDVGNKVWWRNITGAPWIVWNGGLWASPARIATICSVSFSASTRRFGSRNIESWSQKN